MRLLVLLFSFSLVSLTFTSQCQTTSQIVVRENKSFEINELLIESEEIAVTSPQQFDLNLKKLSGMQTHFTLFQKDYFDYLTYYQQGYQGEFIPSLNNFNLLFDRTKFIEIKFRVKLKIANIHIISRDTIPAYNALDYSLNIISDIDNNHLRQKAYSLASMFYNSIGEKELSLKFLNLILDNSPTDNDKCIANSLITRIKLKDSSSITTQLKRDIKDIIKICEGINNHVFANLLKMDWLSKLLSSSNTIETYKLVLKELLNTEKNIESTNYKNLISIKNGLLAKVYWELNEIEKSLNLVNLVLIEDKSIGDTIQKIDLYQILIDHHISNNNYLKSYNLLIEKNKIKLKYYDEEQTRLMAFQTVKHNNIAKTQEIKFLSNKNKLMTAEAKLSTQTATNQKLIILFLTALTGFILLWGFRAKKVQKNYKHLSETDGMTGIYNRKGLKDFMEALLLESKKADETVAYAIFDLDCFKKINDKFGHIKGDWVIKKVIQQCQLIQNNQVTFGRIGGEEFAIAMRDSNSEDLSQFAEKCRNLITDIDSSDIGCDFLVSASFGITSTDLSGYVLSDLMTHADKAMYDAKKAGRNMVVNYKYNLSSQI